MAVYISSRGFINTRSNPHYGYWRPVIKEVVEEYLRCGDLKEGFARVRCPDCSYSYLLALACYS
ncbi:MAG: transposase zinc-binding domain-containing protein [bacterium]